MAQTELSGTTAIVTGASRGFGRAIAEALHESGVTVVGVARDGARLEALRAQLGDGFIPVEVPATRRSRHSFKLRWPPIVHPAGSRSGPRPSESC